MRFSPKSEAELSAGGLWPAGDYSFEVAAAEDTVSKASGADMVKLTLHIFDNTGSKKTVWDYLVGSEASQFKVRGFAVATGLLAQYEAGELEAIDMEGRTGRCKIVQQIDRTGAFPDKNSVANYLKPDEASAVEPPKPVRKGSNVSPRAKTVPAGEGTDLNDDIPF